MGTGVPRSAILPCVQGTDTWPYRDRQPRHEMEPAEAVRVVTALKSDGVDVWLDGGWGVDALLEEQVREHDDLDLLVELAATPTLVAALARLGYSHVAGRPASSVVFIDAVGRQVDVHLVVFDDEGGGVYRMEDGRDWTYPAEGFAGRGRVGGTAVRCLTAEVQVLVHAGYELADKDYAELQLLHERFGVALPQDVLDTLAARETGAS